MWCCITSPLSVNAVCCCWVLWLGVGPDRHTWCRVVATCRNPDGATQLHELASQHPGRLHITQMDVTDPESIERAAKEVATVHSHLDLLFNVSAVLHIPGVSRAHAIQSEGPGILLLHWRVQ